MSVMSSDPALFIDSRPQPLAEFLHSCSPDPSTRTMAAAVFALTHWQMVGRAMTRELPWMLLINAGGADTDPLDAFADDCSTGLGRKGPSESGRGMYTGGTPQKARATMISAIKLKEQLGSPTPQNESQIKQFETLFEDAKATGYGSGRTGQYSRAWDDELGWLTDSTGSLILRLDQPEDHVAFRKDVLENPGILLGPFGPGKNLNPTRKVLAVAGSLAPAEWDDPLVLNLIRLGMPVFHLPHFGQEPLNIKDELNLLMISTRIGNKRLEKSTPVVAANHLPANDWFRHYEKLLRQRLREMPGAYEFSVLRAVHELGEVCAAIAIYGSAPETPADETSAMYMDLHAMALRGIVIGIASLSYHCIGFHAGCPREEAVKLLRHLREKGALSRRDLQRKFPALPAGLRDQVLSCLCAEGLVTLEGRMVAAVPLAAFMKMLHARPEFREPVYCCPALPEAEASEAAGVA